MYFSQIYNSCITFSYWFNTARILHQSSGGLGSTGASSGGESQLPVLQDLYLVVVQLLVAPQLTLRELAEEDELVVDDHGDEAGRALAVPLRAGGSGTSTPTPGEGVIHVGMVAQNCILFGI